MAKSGRESCYNCAYSYRDWNQEIAVFFGGFPSRPACANHPESLGRMRQAPRDLMCRNYRPKLATPEGEVKQISLGDGYYAYVDAADFEWLNQWTWSMRGGYAIRLQKRTVIYMHREIMKPPQGMIVDHKNRNKLDNTRDNLRNVTQAENAQNRPKRRGTSSQFLGVSYDKKCDKYRAQVYYRDRSHYIGLFTDEIEAAQAHDRKVVELFGEFARLNFPEEWPPQRRAEIYAKRDAAEKEDEKTKGRRQKTIRRGDACVARTSKSKRAQAGKGPVRNARRVSTSGRATGHRPRGTTLKERGGTQRKK